MTTPNRAALLALQDKLAGVMGPDRGIDRALSELVFVRDERYLGTQEDDGSGWKPCKTAVWVDPGTDNWVTTAKDGREYTASIDAALALAERLNLPWAEILRGAIDDAAHAAIRRAQSINAYPAVSDLALFVVRRIVAALLAKDSPND